MTDRSDLDWLRVFDSDDLPRDEDVDYQPGDWVGWPPGQPAPALCEDCSTNCTPLGEDTGWEWYMVTDEVWAAVRMGDGFLCVGCLEARLGRQLDQRDFTGAPVNSPDPINSDRLNNRLTAPDVSPCPSCRGRR